MIKIFRQIDGQQEKLYAETKTLKEAKSLLKFIKQHCEVIIGEGKKGFYAKVFKKNSIPFAMRIN